MARKTEETIRAENEVLARALVTALTANNYSTDVLTGTLPSGFLASFRDCLPEEFQGRWKLASMPNQWKVRKAALIPMVKALLKRPEEPTVIHENTAVLQTEEPADVIQEPTRSYTDERITSEHSVLQGGPYDPRTHGLTEVAQPSQADEQTEAPVFSMHTPEIEPDRAHPSIHGNTTEDIPETSSDGTGEPAFPTTTQDIQIDQTDRDALRELLTWWRSHRGELMPTATQERPVFRGNRDAVKTIRLTRALERAAERYIKKHRSETGGNFSAWVEQLIFDALGRPTSLVELDDDQTDD